MFYIKKILEPQLHSVFTTWHKSHRLVSGLANRDWTIHSHPQVSNRSKSFDCCYYFIGIVPHETKNLNHKTLPGTQFILLGLLRDMLCSNKSTFLMFFPQERPTPTILSKLLVPGAEPDKTREPWPCHTQWHLHKQCYRPLGTNQRGCHPPL